MGIPPLHKNKPVFTLPSKKKHPCRVRPPCRTASCLMYSALNPKPTTAGLKPAPTKTIPRAAGLTPSAPLFIVPRRKGVTAKRPRLCLNTIYSLSKRATRRFVFVFSANYFHLSGFPRFVRTCVCKIKIPAEFFIFFILHICVSLVLSVFTCLLPHGASSAIFCPCIFL